MLCVSPRSSSQGNKLSLAILHPRKLVVYNVVAIGANGKMLNSSVGSNEAASYYDLNKSYEHKLDRTAFNFCYGPFGGVYGKDFICVQSLDGQLSFLEQENFAFSRFLSNALIPGPICYVAKIDSFVIANANREVECYKYQILGAAHGAEKKGPEDEAGHSEGGSSSSSVGGPAAKKPIQTDWVLNLGESIQQIFVARYSRSLAASQIDIVVLAEQTLFTLKENGQIRLQKRLDYNPSTCVAYNNSDAVDTAAGEKDVGGSNQNLIIASHQNSCMVYRDMQLVWAARTQAVPVAVRVAAFAGIKGFLVTMTDACEVQVSYLGTDPPLTGVNGAAESAGNGQKELDYEAMDEEHRALLKVIKQASTDSMVEPKERITIRAQLGGSAEGEIVTDSSPPQKGDLPDEEACCKDDRTGALISVVVRLYLSYNGKSDIESPINLSLAFSPAFRCSAGRTITVPGLKAGAKTPVVLALRFRALKGPTLPCDLNLLVLASYLTPNNEPRTARLDTKLPLSLATRVVSPLKNCQYMFTLDTNRSPPSLMDIFPDVLEPVLRDSSNGEVARTAANVLTLVFHAGGAAPGSNAQQSGSGGGCDVTILVSKKSGRYRLQSSVFEALNLVTSELVSRLTGYYANEDAKVRSEEPSFQVLFKDLLPLHDYFLLIDRHFAVRQAVRELRSKLEKLAHQFRVIQKRLLVRYKDKNPAPLLSLDTLLQETYTQMSQGGSEMTSLVSQMRDLSNNLSCATSLMLLLIRFKYDLDDQSFEVLRAHLTPSVAIFDRNVDLGWEEVVDSSTTALLRGALAKPTGDKAAPPPTISSMAPMEALKDCAKLKRHIQIVCDRLAKGIRLVKSVADARAGNNACTSARCESNRRARKQPRQHQSAHPPAPAPARCDSRSCGFCFGCGVNCPVFCSFSARREKAPGAAAAPGAIAAPAAAAGAGATATSSGARPAVPQPAPLPPPKQIPTPSQQAPQQQPAQSRRRHEREGQETLQEEGEVDHD